MASRVARRLGKIAKTPSITGENKGTVVFLHGTCDSGEGLKSWVSKILQQEFQFKFHRVIYPSAPTIPYTLMDNKDAAVWFNRLSPGPHLPEDKISIDEMAQQLNELIAEEQSENGKIVVGGFSTGGTMALHLGYRFNPNISGVFALSSFLNEDSSVYSNLESLERQNPTVDDSNRNITENGHLLDKPPPQKKILPELFMSHGRKDPLVHHNWSQNTFDKLKNLGTDGHLYTFPKQSHEITKSQLVILHNWIEEVLSDVPKPKITKPKPFHINDEHAVPLEILSSRLVPKPKPKPRR